MPRVVVVSPPFLSHAQPLSVLAGALRDRGADVHFACAPAFEHLARRAGADFVPLSVTRNANTGVAEATRQDAGEAARLREFLDATREGAVATLLTQARHRRADMLADPEGVLEALRATERRLRPDWYVVDQLSYPVTLALHCLGVPYATFCPGHPSYVLSGPDSWFGVPYAWPDAVRPDPAGLAELYAAARDNDEVFTGLFAAFARAHAPARPAPGRAFALSSAHAVVHAYPEFPWLPTPPRGPVRLFAGHMAAPPAALDAEWGARLKGLRAAGDRVVLVALGTFLSARDDVLRTVVRGVLEGLRDVSVVVAAGERAGALADLAGERAVVVRSVPQQALLEHVDAMVHHGGGNSFTECLRAGVPALVLPFSSDQFSVAHDAERSGAGVVRDPNTLTPTDVAAALETLWNAAQTRPSGPDGVPGPEGLSGPAGLAASVREHGPDWAAGELLTAMGRAVSGR
ncbi:glycosyltransferase [Streptomyces heilongjiangensis]|uniref:Glycosyltransferase n=1 Tax=Streptomyces heilongjiangensis TaxID=945052 RepID=A0ABW1B0I7_9ACTN|nr:glycosyltransferase [Streptomyces heilongjiangensis]MDC2946492.1 glycosyltransferase [Streptomyces heilongjiangensis]